MRIHHPTSIYTCLLLFAIVRGGSSSREQFHNERFLDGLDADIGKAGKSIHPIPDAKLFEERDNKRVSKGVESNVLPCFQNRRQAFHVPVEEKFSVRKVMRQKVDCSGPSTQKIKIDRNGCYKDISYNVPSSRTVMKLQYRFINVCCPGYKGVGCNEKDLSEIINTDIESLGGYRQDEVVTKMDKSRLNYNLDHVSSCTHKGNCYCKEGWEGPTCDTSSNCLKPCLNRGKCSHGQCSCDLYWKGNQCEIPICRTPCEHGDCVEPNTCKCRNGWSGQQCKQAICQQECMYGGKCISPDKCECADGYQGEDCSSPYCQHGCGDKGSCIGPNTCMCDDGRSGPACQTVIASKAHTIGRIPVEDSATCSVSGHAFFKTFDDLFYMFPGRCTYQLAGDCIEHSFAVHVSIDPSCSLLYKKPCKRTVYLFFRSDIKIKIDGSGVSVNGQNKTLPHSFKNLLLKRVGNYIMVEGWNGLKLLWDEHDSLYLTLSHVHKNTTCGLCGNYDGDKWNEKKTSQGLFTNDIATFGNSWARTTLNERCQNVYAKDLELMYEKLSDSEKEQVDIHCNTLFYSDGFEKCTATINITPYFRQCREDLANCSKKDHKECVCNTLTQYSRACARHDIALDWRRPSFCPAHCKNGHIHTECGTSCPKTCHNFIHHASCRHSCIDGCFCPSELVSNGTHCINQHQCMCTHEKKVYKNGESIDKDCNKCFCTHGRWKCTENECPASCTVFGDPHFKTFDGKWYDFDGVCKYQLAREINHLFDIFMENVPCSGSTYMVDTCGKSLRVRLNGTEIIMKKKFEILVDGVLVSPPYVGPGITIKQASSCFMRLHASIGLDILYSLYGNKIMVTVAAKYSDKTIGLCGTFDKNQENDFTTSDGNVDNNVATFAKSWKVNPRCKETDIPISDPCELQPQRSSLAEKQCNKLMMEPFSRCHKLINPHRYLELCRHDVCSCADGGQDCLCESIATYVYECATKGVIIKWRNEDVLTQCAIKCPPDQEYQECGSLCKRTCRDLATHKTCTERCIPGCNCPAGTVMDEHGACVAPSQCTCHIDGKVYGPLESINKNKCTSCLCVNGDLSCSHIENCVKSCTGNQIWTDKKVSCFKTCENLQSPCINSINPVGCHCPNDTVWNSHLMKCVKEEYCPCHHNGKSYYDGETYRFHCNTCTCKKSKWKCTTNSCAGTCTLFGDPHYTTFDGKKFHFGGRCNYIIAEDHCGKPGTFRIQAENVACGTTGATCSKSVMITLNDTMIMLQRGEKIKFAPVHIGAIMKARYKLIKTTFFDIIHAEIGVTLMWDRGTRLLISLQPKFRGRTCGLCGNFNGNQEDDFTTPEGDVGITPEIFGDSYKMEESCPDTTPPIHPCIQEQYRAAWSHKQCSIIHSDLFKPCHVVVDPKPYFEACYSDTCGCDMGGDCECLCTAVAAYAQVCNVHQVHVKWRSQEFCPIQCETCEEYKACGTSHPETCENRCKPLDTLPIKCVEGCYCPNGTVKDQNGKCVKVEECSCFLNGIEYHPNSIVMEETEGCVRKCICKSGCLVDCIETCVSTTAAVSTTSTQPSTSSTTRTTTTQTSTSTTRIPYTKPSCTGPTKHQCIDKTTCIDSRKVCDKHCNCPNCTDELNCPTTCPPCSNVNFKCHTTCRCIPEKFVCDHHCDCKDCSDEHCTTTQTPTTKSVLPTTPLCPQSKIFKVCISDCREDCLFLLKNKNCASTNNTCRADCGCPSGLKNNGTHCVLPSDCACWEKSSGKLYPPGKSWVSECSVKTCINDTIISTPKPCPTPYCPTGKIVKLPTKCCPVCVCPGCTFPTTTTIYCKKGAIKCKVRGITECISGICDGEKDCDDGIDEKYCPTVMPPPCNQKLGLADSKKIPDSHFTASSSAGVKFRPSNARLNPVHPIKQTGGAWCAKTGPGPHWIQVDLGVPMQVTKVATKGQVITSRYVLAYRLLYSMNGAAWDVLREHGQVKVFSGNSNSDDLVTNKLHQRIVARYIKIYVEQYVGDACLRMELYGCPLHLTTPSPTHTTNITTRCPGFLCHDHEQCIPQTWVCNNRTDCHDGSDEKDCGTCSPSQFKCLDGTCIPKVFVCDGDPDCRHGEDERNCNKTCKPSEFRCYNGHCINSTSVCDKQCDCHKCEDESQNCTTTTSRPFTSTSRPFISTTPETMVTKIFTETRTPQPQKTGSLPTTIPTSKPTKEKTTILTSKPTKAKTTECPPKSICICENTCDTLAENQTACTHLTCIDECKCPSGYIRNNRTGYCVRDLRCLCMLHHRIYKVGAVVENGTCKQCICQKTGFVCNVKYCPIKHCPAGKVLTHYSGDKCCECTKPPCRKGQTLVEHGCPITCPSLQNGSNTCEQPKPGVCVCPGGKLDNGTSCIAKHDCHCVVNGTIHSAESHWPKGACHQCKCFNGEVKCGKMCPITNCPAGYKLVNPSGDKCCYCEPIPTTQETTTYPTSTATPTTTAATTPTRGKCAVITTEEDHVDAEGCKTNTSFERTKCVGACPSETTFEYDKGKAVSDCKCCKPMNYRVSSVTLRCPDGRTKALKNFIFTSCTCYGCSANPFEKDFPMESSDEYALKR